MVGQWILYDAAKLVCRLVGKRRWGIAEFLLDFDFDVPLLIAIIRSCHFEAFATVDTSAYITLHAIYNVAWLERLAFFI